MSFSPHFTLVVIGDNPDEIVKKYDSNNKVEPYLAFKYENAEKYKQDYLKQYKALLDSNILNEETRERIESEVKEIEEMKGEDFYDQMTEGYIIDDETGDAYCDKNLNGKYDSCKIGNVFSMPLITKDGEEVYTALKKDVDWEKVHMTDPRAYEVAWDTVMEGKKPESKDEENIYNNMKGRTAYFEAYKTRENYIKANTSFWGMAVVDEKGWTELESDGDQFEWVINFFSRFIEKLDDNTRISIYECVRY